MTKLLDALLAKLGLMRISQMPKIPSIEFDFQTRFIRIDFGNWITRVQGWVCPTPDGPLQKMTLPDNPLLPMTFDEGKPYRLSPQAERHEENVWRARHGMEQL